MTIHRDDSFIIPVMTPWTYNSNVTMYAVVGYKTLTAEVDGVVALIWVVSGLSAFWGSESAFWGSGLTFLFLGPGDFCSPNTRNRDLTHVDVSFFVKPVDKLGLV